jgi:CDP-paratose 2-epimerase
VIAGPWQFGKVDQGIFTHWMLAHYFKKPLKYIGFGAKGKQVRDLLHVEDLFYLIDLQANFLSKINGKTYNVGGGRKNSLSLSELTKICQEITGNRIKIGKDFKDRPGDISIYISDNKKVCDSLNWIPKRTPKEILNDIYLWIDANKNKIKEGF